MSYCINPNCPNPTDPDNINNRLCRNCASELLIQGRYLVMRLLSDQTGFGKIYEAYEGSTPKILKVLKETLNKNSKVVELFQQEAIVLSQLKHPGIPKVELDGYFLFKPKNYSDGLHCIIMEKIDGLNLKEWMQQQGNNPISDRQAINWLQQLVEILHLVHQKNYFHRDIKPQNIMIRSTGQLVLIDFGTAREVTETYLQKVGEQQITTIISAGYTPPEQIHGEAVLQSDFYALGRTFVYLLTGKKLVEEQIYNNIINEFIWHNHAPYVSPKLADFIDKLMSPDLEERYQNTQEILDELNKVVLNTSSYLNIKIQDKKICQDKVQESSSYAQATTAIETRIKFNHKWLLVGGIAIVSGLTTYGLLQFYSHYNQQVVVYENISLIKTISAHSGYINHLTFSPDGQTLVSASADKTIKIWSVATGEQLRTLKGHFSYVNYLVISPDGQTLVSASADKTIKIWNLSTGAEIRTLKGHQNFVNSLAISPDGQTLVSGSADKTIKIWNIYTGKEIYTLKGHDSYINCLTISQDGQTLVSGSADKTIKIWNLIAGKEIYTLKGHTNFVNSVAITPDGQTLASGSADKTIKIWNLVTKKEVKTINAHSYVNYIAISPDGQKLISANADKTIKIWSLSTGGKIGTLKNYTNDVNYLAISPDWQTIATGIGRKNIKIWHPPKGF